MKAEQILKKIGSKLLYEIEEHFAKKPLTVYEHGYLNGMILDGYLPNAKFGIEVISLYRKSCAKPGKVGVSAGPIVASPQARLGQAARKGRVAKPVASLPKKKTALKPPLLLE